MLLEGEDLAGTQRGQNISDTTHSSFTRSPFSASLRYGCTQAQQLSLEMGGRGNIWAESRFIPLFLHAQMTQWAQA